MSIFIRTVPNVMRHYGCTADDAQRYIDLRDEGYSTYQAALMAGLSDPPETSDGSHYVGAACASGAASRLEDGEARTASHGRNEQAETKDLP